MPFIGNEKPFQSFFNGCPVENASHPVILGEDFQASEHRLLFFGIEEQVMQKCIVNDDEYTVVDTGEQDQGNDLCQALIFWGKLHDRVFEWEHCKEAYAIESCEQYVKRNHHGERFLKPGEGFPVFCQKGQIGCGNAYARKAEKQGVIRLRQP